MSTNRLACQAIEFLPATPSSGTPTLNLNTANVLLAAGFILDTAKTLTEVSAFVSGTGGTPTTATAQCDVYGDSAGLPSGASLGSSPPNAAPAAATWLRCGNFASGAGVSLSAATQYYVAFSNKDATPASNTYTLRYGSTNTGLVRTGANSTKFGFTHLHSTTGTAGWGSALANVTGMRLGFSDGSYLGIPVSSIAAGADKAFGSNEVGVQFTTPSSWPTINAIGAEFFPAIVGAPTGQIRYRIYLNGSTTPAATTGAPVISIGTTAFYLPLRWGSPVAIAPNTQVNITFGDTAADSTTNAYISGFAYTWDTDANSQNLLPVGGANACTFNGTTFTVNNALLHPFSLLLDDVGGEFTVSGGGGGCPGPLIVRGQIFPVY